MGRRIILQACRLTSRGRPLVCLSTAKVLSGGGKKDSLEGMCHEALGGFHLGVLKVGVQQAQLQSCETCETLCVAV